MRRVLGVIAGLVLLTSCGTVTNPPTKIVKTPPITIAFGGDTNAVEQVSDYLYKGGNPFSSVAPILTKADLAVINLESAITTRSQHQDKQYYFNSNPMILDAAVKSGIDVVNIGNNHAGDYFRDGLSETIDAIEARKLKVIGGGKNGRDAWTAKVFDIRGTKVALLGIAKINGGVGTLASGELAGTTDAWSAVTVETAIKAASRQAKYVILYVHWGVEGDTCPNPEQVADAKRWLDWGATAIIGSHPHRQQPAVRYGEKIVDYSLGNFAFYNRTGAGAQSGVGLLKIKADGISYEFIPASIDRRTGTPKLLIGSAKSAAIKAKQSKCKVLSNQN